MSRPFSYRIFLCICCRKITLGRKSDSPREAFNCIFCNSSSRERAVIFAVTRTFGPQRSRLKSRKAVGVSDGNNTASTMQKIFGGNYQNYQFHIDPKLDITHVPFALHNTADIVTCSEVLEHVQPPVSEAFSGLYSLLKPGGVLVLSVPHTPNGNPHKEHFPIMRSSELVLSPEPKLVGFQITGEEVEFTNLVFHGGIGSTLEYRVFSENSLLENLIRAGFEEIRFIPNSHLFGISWEPWSRTWVAKKSIS